MPGCDGVPADLHAGTCVNIRNVGFDVQQRCAVQYVHALVNPDHLLILLNHLRCAVFEPPFQQGEGFGRLPAERVEEFLDFLAQNGNLHRLNGKYFWVADAYPAAGL